MMELIDRYQQAIGDLLYKVRSTQREAIIKAGEIIADTVEHGNRIYLSRICHGIENDLIARGGGPAFYKPYVKDETVLKEGDVLIVGSVSGKSPDVVNLSYDSVNAGVKVILLTSMEYAQAVEAVHPSGKKLYEFVTHTIDNCAPPAEAMLEIEGIDARFAAASGIACDFIMWSVTAATVEKMMQDGYTPGIFKSVNFPGGWEQYERTKKHYEEFGW